MNVANQGLHVGRHRPIMKPSERLDAMRNMGALEREAAWADDLRPVTLDQLERAERAVREGGMGPMFSEQDTYTDFHFGTDIPTGVISEHPPCEVVARREFQSAVDADFADMDTRDGGAFLWLIALCVALGVVLMISWAAGQ